MTADPFQPLAWHVARWGDEQYSGGSWSALAPGGSAEHRATLGRPIDGRLVIAGDATNPTAPSMTHGAHDEGVRAARWAPVGLSGPKVRRCIVVSVRGQSPAKCRRRPDS